MGNRYVTRDTVLQHPARQQLYDVICQKPGIREAALRKEVKTKNMIHWHLDKLVKSGLVLVVRGQVPPEETTITRICDYVRLYYPRNNQ